MALSLLRAPTNPDPGADRGRQAFTYWHGSFWDCDVVRQGYELNIPARCCRSSASDDRSFFGLAAANVILETVKPAADGSGDLILRLYEAKRCATRTRLTSTLPLSAAWRCDLLEQPSTALPCLEGGLDLELRPFEILTLRLRCG